MPQDASEYISFLIAKGIDAARFQLAMPSVYARCLREFEIAGRTGLDLSKKFYWNDWRKEFPFQRVHLQEE